jgi:predicted ester cyclase
LGALLIGQKDGRAKGKPMSKENNKIVVRRYIEEVINQGNLELIDTCFAPDMREQVKGFLTSSNDPFPDGREEIQELIAEDDIVMVRWIFRGTQQGEFMGIAPTWKPIEITGYGTYRLENDQIVWDTVSFDWLAALEQIGATIHGPGV